MNLALVYALAASAVELRGTAYEEAARARAAKAAVTANISQTRSSERKVCTGQCEDHNLAFSVAPP